MKRSLYIIFVVLLCSMYSIPAFSQQTDAMESSKKYRKKNLGVESKQSVQKTRRGGQLTYPKGIEGKKFNFGFTVGGAFALMDALSEEKCPLGGNFNFFMHGIFKNTKTFALGAEIKAFYLHANKEKYQNHIAASFENNIAPNIIVNDWILGAVQVSAMGNFNPMPRCNIQIKINLGPMIGILPEYKGEYQAKKLDGVNVIRNFGYSSKYDKLVIGLSATLGMDVLYAISAHTEFKVGVDWTYLRFEYERIEVDTNPLTYVSSAPKTINVPRQFGIFDVHIGFAFSF